jgi:hypothetical protein
MWIHPIPGKGAASARATLLPRPIRIHEGPAPYPAATFIS